MLPDLALLTDKDEILRQLRPLQLDIDPCDPDFRICIRLCNGYALVLTAGDMSLGKHDSWVRPLPVTKLVDDLLEVLASRVADKQRINRTVIVPIYSAFARLTHDDAYKQLPTAHHFVESPSPVALVENALVWCREATGLPLQWSHLDDTNNATQ